MPPVVLRRSLFGFKAQQVHEMLAQRDVAMSMALERTASVERELDEARDRVKTADLTVQEAQERASAAERRIQELEAELASVREELVQNPAQSDTVSTLLMHGLAPILDAARESAASMIAEATKLSEQRVGQADDVLRTLREQARAMASWWEGIQRLLEPTLSTLAQARARMGEIPARVEQALAPLADLMGAVEEQLGEIAAASEPPPFGLPLDQQGKILDLTQAREGQGTGTTVEEQDREDAGTAVGLRRASHAWWPEVSPSVRSAGR